MLDIICDCICLPDTKYQLQIAVLPTIQFTLTYCPRNRRAEMLDVSAILSQNV